MEGNEENDEVVSKKAKYAQIIEWVFFKNFEGGAHFVIPCQAKSAKDRFGIVQVVQDIALSKIKYPSAICKPIAIQFIGSDSVAILELAVTETDEILALNTVEERHYDLIPRSEIDEDNLQQLMRSEP